MIKSKYSCATCYWRLTGCGKEGEQYCGYYYPNDYDDEFESPERAYEVAREETWAQAGFSIRELEED